MIFYREGFNLQERCRSAADYTLAKMHTAKGSGDEAFVKNLESCAVMFPAFFVLLTPIPNVQFEWCVCPCSNKQSVKNWRHAFRVTAPADPCPNKTFQDANAFYAHVEDESKSCRLHKLLKEFIGALFKGYWGRTNHKALHKKLSHPYNTAESQEDAHRNR
jgi:hypothetical protein